MMINKYDLIPEEIIINAKNILDIGIGDLSTQLMSKYKNIFLSDKYTGIDNRSEISTNLKYKNIDILDFETTKKYDLVICIEIIEHVQFRDWEKLFNKLKSLISENGYLFITTPYKQEFDNIAEANDYLNEMEENR